MVVNIFRCRTDEISYVKDAIINIKGACALYESIGAKGSDVKDDIIYTYRY